MSEEILFRRATFGGFNRDDVMQYISTMSMEAGDKEKVERELSKVKSELSGLKESAGSKDDTIKQLNAEIDALKAEVDAKKVKISSLESEIDIKNTRLMSMQIELEAAKKAAVQEPAPAPVSEPEPEPEPEPVPAPAPVVEEKKDENTLSAERLMQDSMAYAERYIQSAGLVANNIKKGTLEKLKTAANQLAQMRDTASQLAISSEKFNLIIDKLSNDVDEAAKGFEQNDKKEEEKE